MDRLSDTGSKTGRFLHCARNGSAYTRRDGSMTFLEDEIGNEGYLNGLSPMTYEII